jgi:tetratricopeptide (TPR) repeat protein
MSYSNWTDAEDRARRAERLIHERRWHEALDELRAATTVNPHQASWHFLIGLALEGLHQFEQAIDAYADVLALEPEHLHALNHTGLALHETGRYKQAVAVFEQIEKIDPTFEACYCNRIRSYTELGNHQAAEEAFYTARLYRDQCPTCYYNIAISLAMRGLTDRAIYCWHRTIDLAGDDVNVRARIANACCENGRLEEARRHYQLALRMDAAHVPTLTAFAQLLIDLHRLDEADRRISTAELHAPLNATVHLARARLLVARQQHRHAQAVLIKVLQLDPTLTGTNFLLAKIALASHDTTVAKAHLRAELL